MKITNLKTYYVPKRFLFLKIETDSGICGWGEPLVEGRAETLSSAVEEWKEYLIGKDPMKIEDIWQVMYRGAFYYGGPVFMSTIAGINEALWDIKGKYYNAPIYDLLGGKVKDKVMVYRGIKGDTPEDLVKDANSAIEQGYKLVKLSCTEATSYLDSFDKVDTLVSKIDAVSKAIKGRADFALDFHGRIHKPMAKVIVSEINKYPLSFIEEPVKPSNSEALRDIANHTSAPIALGERLFNRWDYKSIIQDGYVDILQPDISHCGGISETKRVASMAEAFDMGIAPHCPLSVISFAACIQFDIMTPNVVFQEQHIDIHRGVKDNKDLVCLKDPSVFKFENGYVLPPKGPGLGIEIDEEQVEKYNINHKWRNPVWRTHDGTPTEW
jgi:galactonate dehydratase